LPYCFSFIGSGGTGLPGCNWASCSGEYGAPSSASAFFFSVFARSRSAYARVESFSLAGDVVPLRLCVLEELALLLQQVLRALELLIAVLPEQLGALRFDLIEVVHHTQRRRAARVVVLHLGLEVLDRAVVEREPDRLRCLVCVASTRDLVAGSRLLPRVELQLLRVLLCSVIRHLLDDLEPHVATGLVDHEAADDRGEDAEDLASARDAVERVLVRELLRIDVELG
jgi:hypothetical protein